MFIYVHCSDSKFDYRRLLPRKQSIVTMKGAMIADSSVLDVANAKMENVIALQDIVVHIAKKVRRLPFIIKQHFEGCYKGVEIRSREGDCWLGLCFRYYYRIYIRLERGNFIIDSIFI